MQTRLYGEIEDVEETSAVSLLLLIASDVNLFCMAHNACSSWRSALVLVSLSLNQLLLPFCFLSRTPVPAPHALHAAALSASCPYHHPSPQNLPVMRPPVRGRALGYTSILPSPHLHENVERFLFLFAKQISGCSSSPCYCVATSRA